MQFSQCTEVSLPQEKAPLSPEVNKLSSLVQKFPFSAEELGVWYGSITNYAFWAKRFAEDHDPSKIIGQDNLLRYRPHRDMCIRIQSQDSPMDLLRSLAAALSCGAKITVSWSDAFSHVHLKDQLHDFTGNFSFVQETEEQFCRSIKRRKYRRVRLLSSPDERMLEAASHSATFLDSTPVLSHGRFELLHYLREISFSIDYHRYGNLGLREKEERKPLL